MKFLVINTPKEIMFTLPPTTLRQLMEATHAWTNQQKQAGTISEIYVIPEWRRTVVISEAESAEAMAQRATEVPLGGFMNTEIYPLADFNECGPVLRSTQTICRKKFEFAIEQDSCASQLLANLDRARM